MRITDKESAQDSIALDRTSTRFGLLLVVGEVGHRPAVWMNQHPSRDLMSGQSDALSTLSVHPASPSLLTRGGPLEGSDSRPAFTEATQASCTFIV